MKFQKGDLVQTTTWIWNQERHSWAETTGPAIVLEMTHPDWIKIWFITLNRTAYAGVDCLEAL